MGGVVSGGKKVIYHRVRGVCHGRRRSFTKGLGGFSMVDKVEFCGTPLLSISCL